MLQDNPPGINLRLLIKTAILMFGSRLYGRQLGELFAESCQAIVGPSQRNLQVARFSLQSPGRWRISIDAASFQDLERELLLFQDQGILVPGLR
jgi:hypothetical protein